jgi:hypothetical protein
MIKRKRNALMADVNRGLKNNAFVLGGGIGAVTRFSYQAYLKRMACACTVPFVPVTPIPPAEPYRYYEGTDATNFVNNWNNTTTFYMEEFGGLGPATAHGYTPGPISYTLTLPNLGTHSKIRYKVKWHLVESIDFNDTSHMYIGNEIAETNVLTFTKTYNTIPSVTPLLGLTAVWSEHQPYSYRPWSQTSGYQSVDGYLDIDSGWIDHTSSTLTVRHLMGANQDQSDEAMYLTHVEVLTE